MQGLGLLLVEAPLCLLRLSIEVWCSILLGLFHYFIHTVYDHESNSANKLRHLKNIFVITSKGFVHKPVLCTVEVCVWLSG